MLRTIKLYGELGKKFGKEHKAYVNSVAEAVKFLKANFKGFEKYVMDSSDKIRGYEVWDGKYNVDATANDFNRCGDGVIKIIPRVKGGGAAARIIVGVVLIIVSFTPFGAPFAGYLVPLGLSLIAGGIIELMAPKSPAAKTDEKIDTSSYVFSGPVNVTKQGNPVAIGYGEMIVGSQVISASITTKEIPV